MAAGNPAAESLKIAPMGTVGRLGLYHIDITGPPPRGPFDKVAPSPTATYPALWNHDANKETRLICEPDSQLQVRPGMEAKAATEWDTRSRTHINRDFRFNSQPLAAALTEQPSIGGRAWPNVIFDDKRGDYAFIVWANSTLGLLSFWWHSNRQQSGRGTISIRSAETLPVLDFRALTDEQLLMAEIDLQRVPRQGAQARLPRGRRRQPGAPRPPGHPRPAGVRRGHLPGGSAGWRPSGAPSRRCTEESRGPRGATLVS